MREDLRLGLSFLVSVAELAGVATPLARAFLAIGGAICGEDFMQDGRTLASLGLGGLDRAELQTLAARGILADDHARPAIACLGAGRMGRGIAVAFAYAGHTRHHDRRQGARSAEQFAKLEADALGRGQKDAGEPGAVRTAEGRRRRSLIVARVSVVPASDSDAALADAGIVFEGVPEVVELKREVLGGGLESRRPRCHHRLDHIDHPGRRSLRRGRTSRPLSQRALAQSGLSDPAGRDFAGQGHRSGHHRRA